MKVKFLSWLDFYDHLSLLDAESVHMRFGYTVSNEGLRRYCQSIQSPGFVIGTFVHGLPVSAAHVAILGGEAELGISVIQRHRREGHAEILLREVVRILRPMDYSKIYTLCLPGNKPFIGLLNKLRDDLSIKYEIPESASERKACITLE